MLSEIESYMFSFDTMKAHEKNTFSASQPNMHKKDTKVPLQTLFPKMTPGEQGKFIPRQRDSLFWCFYIAKHGLDNFRLIANYFVQENNFKITTVELARKEKVYLKAFKVKLGLFESQLVNEKQIGFSMLQALCILYKVNIILVRKRSYLDFCYFPENSAFIIEEIKKSGGGVAYSIEHNATMEKYDGNIKKIKEELWKQESIEKPLRAISAYKSVDLQNICNRLQLPIINSNGKNKTKTELYSSVIENINL